MKVAIDAQLAVGTATGIGEFVHGLVEALQARGVDVDALCEPKLNPWRFDRRVFWDQVLLPQRARASGAQLLHCASGTMPLNLALPMVVTVHDVAWLRVQAHARPYARYYFGKFSVERYRHASAIAVDSAFSRSELLELVPGLDPARVSVVYPGVAADFCALERASRGDGRTILVIGTVERRKNLEAIVEALPFLEGARVVSVGPFTPYQDECLEKAESLGVRDRIECRGYVERADVLQLYATCAVVAVPSRYEGFGYAAAQALCAGTPVVVADQASLPEVAGDDGRIVPVDSVQAWVSALREALDGQADAAARASRARSIERFAWAKSAADMSAIYESVVPAAAWERESVASP
ncbi:MAG TPA: glycosyltransferase family 1 protein [Candidatus Baltobacteraceae bacterium]|nr:glycosyltransferase family 1 protein [Candidatus Baltobacteraceae bacterium]